MSTEDTIIANFEGIKDESLKKPYLAFMSGPRLGQRFELDKESFVVGRSPDADLWIQDNAISRNHFRIATKGGKLVLEDLGSTNGTFVNGQPVKKKELHDGDRIQISPDSILEIAYLDETQRLSDEKLYRMGVMDPVTNIYNKRYFLDRLKDEFAFVKRRKGKLVVIIFDIDHFKQLNDSFGHLAGDLVLQKMCAAVSRMIRSDDVFARYGGEEFVIFMRAATLANGRDLAERIRDLVAQLRIPHETKTISITVSLGVARYEEWMKDHLDLIGRADDYLYESKNAGRNRVTGPAL